MSRPLTICGYPLESLVLGDILRERARTHRDATFLKFREGELTFGDLDAMANRLSQGFAALGVGPRDHVAVMLPNSADFVSVIFGLAKLGAVAVPINTAYKGELLRHVLDSSDATVLVVDEPFCDRIQDLSDKLGGVHRLVVRTDPAVETASLEGLGAPAVELRELLRHGDDDPNVPVAFSDLQAIMYTSGTTGPSKGVLTPHALALTCALDSLEWLNRWGKTIYCPLPLFHAAGLWDGMMAALLSGTPIAIVEKFSASRFWDDVRQFDAQVCMSVFAMIPILLNQPASPRDKDHPLETFYMGKSSLDGPLYERFGVRAVETYTSTEAGIATASPYGQWRVGSMGKEHSERFEVQVVDEHDRQVPDGEPGELVLRPKQPFVLTPGYYGFPEVTAHTFRNAWFHTGDKAYRDDDGYFYFLDRMKDAIRRRGENISAFDLECEINLHPAVLECAAIGVPSDLGEEEVKVAVVVQQGADLDPGELIDYCERRMPAFMVPRYIEVVAELPRTPTDKIAKHKLRAMGDHGLTPQTWDAKAEQASSLRGADEPAAPVDHNGSASPAVRTGG